jgi:hypothetical protein
MTPGTPDENRLVRLIARAHDRLPLPDTRRLAVIEARLVHRAASARSTEAVARWRYWWFALALAAAGSAAALWWALDYASRQGTREVTPVELSPPVTSNERSVSREAQEPASKGMQSGDDREQARSRSPVIYQQQR